MHVIPDRRLRLLGVSCLLCLSVPQAVDAATVEIRPFPYDEFGDELHFVAGAGEHNRLSIHARWTPEGRLLLTVRDSGAVVTGGEACTRIDEHAVECAQRGSTGESSSLRYFHGGRVELADLDDELAVTHESSSPYRFGVRATGGSGDDRLGGLGELLGEAGADELIGSRGPDRLRGGSGNDRLFGGAGEDSLEGGGGADELSGEGGDDTLSDGDRDGATGADSFDGGTGADMVSYRRRRATVSVDLADPAPDGERGESDRLVGIEGATGGRGADRLAGDDGANALSGTAGRDRLIGRGGDDVLHPGTGGGRVSCGPGRDSFLYGVTSRDLLDPDCEGIHPSEDDEPIFTANPVSMGAGGVRFRLDCPPETFDGEPAGRTECEGRVVIRQTAHPSRVLATGAFPLRRWRRHLVDVRLTALGRRLTSRARGVRATVRLGVHVVGDGDTDPYRSAIRWTIQLKVPG